MAFPKPEETAVLRVNGMQFRDWESVRVKHEMYVHPWIHFRFTCSEPTPFAQSLASLQIVPGMRCEVLLAGNQAVDGEVSTRQVFVDSRRHHIEIQGVSDTVALTNNSVVHQTHEFKDTTYKDYATKLLQPLGLNLKESGGSLSGYKFPRISIPPGSTVLEALEIPLRALGGVALTSNPQGDVVCCIGPEGGGDTIYEGNLGRPSYIEANVIFYNSGIANGLVHVGQRPANNKTWGAAAAHELFASKDVESFASSGYSKQLFQSENPAWEKKVLEGRGDTETNLQGQDQITVFVTVNGWTKPSGGLWKINEIVRVISPMLVLKGTEELKTKSITFEQDNQSGTRTTLELCNPSALAGFKPQEGG